MSWLKYSDQELDHQYACSHWSKRPMSPDEIIKQYVDVCVKESLNAEESFKVSKDNKYGPSDRQGVDILWGFDNPKDAPVLVFFHGGYWQIEELNRSQKLLFSQQLIPAGAILMSIGYDLAPSVQMNEIVEQACKGVRFCLERAKQLGSRGVYVSGHSAGAHLAALTYSLIDDHLLKGVIPMSGIFDLRPIIKTSNNDLVKLDESTAWENSPMNMKHIQRLKNRDVKGKALIILGNEESSEFHRQANEYQDTLSIFMDSEILCVKDLDHFSIIEEVVKPNNKVTNAIIKFMELST